MARFGARPADALTDPVPALTFVESAGLFSSEKREVSRVVKVQKSRNAARLREILVLQVAGASIMGLRRSKGAQGWRQGWG